MRLLPLLLLLATRPLLSQLPYNNPQAGFTMTLPAGYFVEAPDPLAPENRLACFVTPGTGAGTWQRICVETAGGTLPRDARPMTFAWKGMDLEGASFSSEMNNQAVSVFAVRVPLRKGPIWLSSMSPLVTHGQAQSALIATLATLQGDAVSSSERAEAAGEKFGLIASVIIALGVGIWIGKRRSAD